MVIVIVYLFQRNLGVVFIVVVVPKQTLILTVTFLSRQTKLINQSGSCTQRLRKNTETSIRYRNDEIDKSQNRSNPR